MSWKGWEKWECPGRKGSGFELLNYRGTRADLPTEQEWKAGGREADGERDSELTTGDALRDEVKNPVRKKVTVALARALIAAGLLPRGGWDFQVPWETAWKGKGIRLEIRKVGSGFSSVHYQLHGLRQFR